MSIRKRTGRLVESVAGQQNLRRLRRTEVRIRGRLADWIAMPTSDASALATSSKSKGAGKSNAAVASKPRAARPRFGPPDPFVDHPAPPMWRHRFLAGLHKRLQPRTYLEIGIRDGRSLTLARCKAIGVDPAYRIDQELQADLRLFRLTSDEFFTCRRPRETERRRPWS